MTASSLRVSLSSRCVCAAGVECLAGLATGAAVEGGGGMWCGCAGVCWLGGGCAEGGGRKRDGDDAVCVSAGVGVAVLFACVVDAVSAGVAVGGVDGVFAVMCIGCTADVDFGRAPCWFVAFVPVCCCDGAALDPGGGGGGGGGGAAGNASESANASTGSGSGCCGWGT